MTALDTLRCVVAAACAVLLGAVALGSWTLAAVALFALLLALLADLSPRGAR